jgi:hypothetical protein
MRTSYLHRASSVLLKPQSVSVSTATYHSAKAAKQDIRATQDSKAIWLKTTKRCSCRRLTLKKTGSRPILSRKCLLRVAAKGWKATEFLLHAAHRSSNMKVAKNVDLHEPLIQVQLSKRIIKHYWSFSNALRMRSRNWRTIRFRWESSCVKNA